MKILDFGLARHTEAPFTSPSSETTWARTAPGTVLGTLGKMSPEQTRGETAGPPSDIFSPGWVLHELLTRKITFARASAAETMAAILSEDPPPPSASDPSIPPALDIRPSLPRKSPWASGSTRRWTWPPPCARS